MQILRAQADQARKAFAQGLALGKPSRVARTPRPSARGLESEVGGGPYESPYHPPHGHGPNLAAGATLRVGPGPTWGQRVAGGAGAYVYGPWQVTDDTYRGQTGVQGPVGSAVPSSCACPRKPWGLVGGAGKVEGQPVAPTRSPAEPLHELDPGMQGRQALAFGEPSGLLKRPQMADCLWPLPRAHGARGPRQGCSTCD